MQGQKAAYKDGDFKVLRAKIDQLAVENVTGGLLGPLNRLLFNRLPGNGRAPNKWIIDAWI